MSMQVAEETSVKRKSATKAAVSVDDEDLESAEPSYTPANMRPGCLLLPEFSRQGGIRFARGADGKSKRVVKDTPRLEKMSGKIINAAYAKLVENFAHVPWGFYCESDEVQKAHDLLRVVQKGARLTNKYAVKYKSDRRMEIDVYALPWDHTDMNFRTRLGKMIAKKLIELRQIYSSKNMQAFRVQLDKVKHLEKVVIGEQHKLVAEALRSTIEQRKVMIAINGDKIPRDWIDPNTGNLKGSIKLDFGPIERAIKHFCPSWKPSDDEL